MFPINTFQFLIHVFVITFRVHICRAHNWAGSQNWKKLCDVRYEDMTLTFTLFGSFVEIIENLNPVVETAQLWKLAQLWDPAQL